MKLPQHTRYDCTPLTGRRDHSWPGGKRLAFCITLGPGIIPRGRLYAVLRAVLLAVR